jgi:hypothetical protein
LLNKEIIHLSLGSDQKISIKCNTDSFKLKLHNEEKSWAIEGEKE